MTDRPDTRNVAPQENDPSATSVEPKRTTPDILSREDFELALHQHGSLQSGTAWKGLILLRAHDAALRADLEEASAAAHFERARAEAAEAREATLREGLEKAVQRWEGRRANEERIDAEARGAAALRPDIAERAHTRVQVYRECIDDIRVVLEALPNPPWT